MDVTKQASEAVDGVQARIGLELDPLTGREKPFELPQSLAAVALLLPQLGGSIWTSLTRAPPRSSRVSPSPIRPTVALSRAGSGSAAAHATGNSENAREATSEARSALECTVSGDDATPSAGAVSLVETPHDEAPLGTVATRVHQAGR